MKKLILVLLCTSMAITVAGCRKKEETAVRAMIQTRVSETKEETISVKSNEAIVIVEKDSNEEDDMQEDSDKDIISIETTE
jgi:hypothetical protein